MNSKIIELLGAIYTRIPKQHRPWIKSIVYGTLLRLKSAVTLRAVRKGKQINFLDFEIAHLEPFAELDPAKDEVFVEAVCSTVSPGTERAVLCGLPGARRAFPYQPGYSCAGKVVRAGKQVRNHRKGDRLVGRMKHASFSVLRPDGLFNIPESVSFEEASFLELGIIVLQGVRKAGIRPGDRVAVLGQGLIGQLANKFARMLGAGRVIAIAQSRRREKTATGPGCAHEYIALGETPGALGEIEADVVIEAVGTPSAVIDALQCSCEGGKIILLGSSRGLGRSVDIRTLAQDRSIDIIGAHISAMPDHDCSAGLWSYEEEGKLFLRLLETKRLTVSDLVTWHARPEDCNEVYEVIAGGGGSQVGIVFEWNQEAGTVGRDEGDQIGTA